MRACTSQRSCTTPRCHKTLLFIQKGAVKKKPLPHLLHVDLHVVARARVDVGQQLLEVRGPQEAVPGGRGVTGGCGEAIWAPQPRAPV